MRLGKDNSTDRIAEEVTGSRIVGKTHCEDYNIRAKKTA